MHNSREYSYGKYHVVSKSDESIKEAQSYTTHDAHTPQSPTVECEAHTVTDTRVE